MPLYESDRDVSVAAVLIGPSLDATGYVRPSAPIPVPLYEARFRMEPGELAAALERSGPILTLLLIRQNKPFSSTLYEGQLRTEILAGLLRE